MPEDMIEGAVAELDPSVGSEPAIESEVVESPTTTEGEQPEVVEGEQPATPEGKEGEQQTTEDGRVIPQWMRALKEANPEAYKKAKTDLFDLRNRRSIHPTPDSARQDHDLVESLGGQPGIDQIREEVGFFKEASGQFLKGDPAFIQGLWKEDPIAAALHVAPMLVEFQKADLDGYKSTIARVWDNEFQQVGFSNALDNLSKAIQAGDKNAALELIKGFQGWHQSITDVAKRGEDPRVKTLLAERNRRQEEEQKSGDAKFLSEYRTQTINDTVNAASKIFDSIFKGHKLSQEDKTDLLRDALRIANQAVTADKSFVEQQSRHLQAKDGVSARKLTNARFERELSTAVQRVAARYGYKPQQQRNQIQQQPAQKQLPTALGWTAVKVRPEPEQVDHSRTTREMIIGGRAILRDGRKVDWSALKKQAAA